MAQSLQSFADLTARVLQWMSLEGDTALPRALVQQALRTAHTTLATIAKWTFHKWTGGATLTLVPGQRDYILHREFHLPGEFRLRSTGTLVREVPDGAKWEHWPATAETGTPEHFMWLGSAPVEVQPSAAYPIKVVAVGVSAISARQWILEGELADGSITSETLTGEATTVNSYRKVLSFTKITGTWENTIQLKANPLGTPETLLTLAPSEFGRQHRVIRLDRTPSTADVIDYEFYRTPRTFTVDGSVADIPQPYDEILVYDALLLLVGYTRATEAEQKRWSDTRDALYLALEQAHSDGLTLGAAPVTIFQEPR